MNKTLKNIIIVVCVIGITFTIVKTSYSIMSEIGFNTDNKIDYNHTLKLTYKNDNKLDIDDKDNSLLFSVVNYGTLDMLYDVLISTKGVNKEETNSIVISIDGKEYKLNDLERKDNKYLLYIGAIKKQNDSRDAISHKVNAWGGKSGSIEVSVESRVVNDLASDVITSLAYKNNKFGLIKDSLNNIRYVGENPYNYIKFNNEIWRVIGVFSTLDDYGKSDRVKIVKNTNEEIVWSDDANLFNNSSLSNYLNSEFYDSIKDKNYFDLVTYNCGEFDSVNNKETALVKENNGYSFVGIVGIPSVSDYLFAHSWMKNNTWLLGRNNNSLENIYYSYSGSVLVKKYNERALVSPVVYLNANIRIVDGDGSMEKPFVIE